MAKKGGGMAGAFGFDSAVLILKAGGRVRRMAWGQSGNWVHLMATIHSTTIQRTTSDGFSVPFTPTAVDILCDDWTAEHIGDMMMTQE